MITFFKSSFLGLWQLWSSLFSIFPYGNSYVPAICLVIIIIGISVLLLSIIRRRNLKRDWGDQYERAESYKRVCNLH
jgi:uncharacterized membrane protein